MAPLHEVWMKLASNRPDLDGLLAAALKVGEINAKTMALLDSTHCEILGTPQPTPVRMTAVEGKAILITGHDMMDCKALLEQTEGKGINVYTHGEMLPASMYPGLKKFKHLVGNYGTAWQAQKFEFVTFPGPILVTSNCIVEPRRSYKDRVYTVNEVGFDGVQHVKNRDFSKLIDQAIKMEGFKKTVEPARFHTVGFNHRAVLPLASQVIESIQKGHLSRIFVIGGCDGTEWDRSYYTDLAEETPRDSIILTLGCAKNRIIHSTKLQNATLSNGMPRVMDMGQCNDAYSAVVVALELAKALDCNVNELPLSLALSHLEQKAAAVLLTLLHLGVKNIRLGPRLPAYITPNVLKILEEKYNLMPTEDSAKDLQLMMQGS
jgi:hydroxylamine reductase